MTIESFLNGLEIHFPEGTPQLIISDNALQFRLTDKVLKRLDLDIQTAIPTYCTQRRVQRKGCMKDWSDW